MTVTALKPRNTVESLREIVQDLLVPDMKAIKVEVESHRRETKTDSDAIRSEIKALGDSLRSELRGSVDSLRSETGALGNSLRNELRLRDEKQSQAIQALSDEIGYALDIRERLAVLEDRAHRA